RPETFAAAVEGVDGVFLLRPPALASMRETLAPFVDAALAHGVGHVVFLSVAGAANNALLPHHAVEQHLRVSGARWTLLRPGFFADNLGHSYRRDLLEDDQLYVPVGHGRVAFVDVRDVAEAAAETLARPDTHAQRAYTLSGPAALSFGQVGELLTEELGRPIRYVEATVSDYVRHLRRRGVPLTPALIQTVLHAGLRHGQGAAVDPCLTELLGRRPRSLRAHVQDHRALWLPAGAGRGVASEPARAMMRS
ncbi:MAG: SDR family NAD(P)-dependent oxidoreductase, partial [Myxococcales bacterium]